MSDGYETIFAVASGVGKSAIAIVRVTGPECENILAAVSPGAALSERHASLIRVRDHDAHMLDRALVIRFVAPRSYTGEDMIEFQVTGSRAVVSGLLRTLAMLPRVRPAEPGEFARRAFENGKLDLVEVEGLVSMIEAETSAQLRHALSMAAGGVSQQCESIRSLILRALAELEAMLDFADEDDADLLSWDRAFRLMEEARRSLRDMLDRSSVSERLRSGMTVTISGPPNSGKSTLLNHLAKREAAIVSPIPGTTRDILELAVELRGYPVVLVDTAGIRETIDSIEIEGIKRALERSANADLVLWLVDENAPEGVPNSIRSPVLIVNTKSDLGSSQVRNPRLSISAKTGEGIDELIHAITDRAQEFFFDAGTVSFSTERQCAAARETMSAIEVAQTNGTEIELAAENLRHAGRALGRVSGRIDVEDVLGEIFSRLCVGK